MSLAEITAQKTIAKAKSDINIRLKGADRNLKAFFAEVKKILDKPDDDIVVEHCHEKVGKAREYEAGSRYITFLFDCFADAKKDTIYTRASQQPVPMKDFSLFI